jgi:phosphatidylglycerol:prolipoprotein diacylglycerol transferase
MHREAFEIFGLTVYWYGILFAGGFFAAVVHWTLLGKRENRPPELASDLALWLMIGGVVGARVAYIIANWADYAADPMAIFRIWEGGLVYYGGLIGGTALTIFMLIRRGEKLAPMGDFIFTALPLGHAFGRTGCHLNGCCHGSSTDFFWGIVFNRDPNNELFGQIVHPTQLLEVGFNIILYIVLLKLYQRNKIPGRIMATYLLTYPIFRFLIEYLRGDGRLTTGPFDAAQYISMVLFTIGLVLWFKCTKPKEA